MKLQNSKHHLNDFPLGLPIFEKSLKHILLNVHIIKQQTRLFQQMLSNQRVSVNLLQNKLMTSHFLTAE